MKHTRYLLVVVFLFSTSTYAAQEDPELLEVYAYVGSVFDNFASANVNDYLNPDASGDTKSRETFGVWFQYPIIQLDDGKDALWVYGLTAHGVRSSDIDCKANPKISVCQDFTSEIADPQERALYMLRSASSLEAMLGFRYEFYDLREGNSSLYISFQKGFVMVDNDDGDASEISHFSVGARIARGVYRNSYLEIGESDNELFTENDKDRLHINAHLTREFELGSYMVPGFIHFSGDFDDGDGADSVQTYVGVALKIN